MKTYPSIPREPPAKAQHYYAFDKLDGSNIRAEWSRKDGIHKYGRRNGLLDDSNPILKRAIPLIEANYADCLDVLFRGEKFQKATAYFEFWGPSSFAGNHKAEEQQTVSLIDLAVDTKGILPPSEYLKACRKFHVPFAPLLWEGPSDRIGDLRELVRTETLEGMGPEGVVVKGACYTPGLPVMFKLKRPSWLARLKEHCNGNEELFKKLA